MGLYFLICKIRLLDQSGPDVPKRWALTNAGLAEPEPLGQLGKSADPLYSGSEILSNLKTTGLAHV